MTHVRRLLLLLLLASATPALADAKSEAQAHIDKATALHGEGKFKEALEALSLAYALDPRPELLYAIGQVHVQLGDCAQAISFYERFLSTKPAAAPAAAAREAIQTCKTAPPDPVVKPEPAPEPVPPPVVTPEPQPAPIQQDTPSSDGPTPWYKDKLGMGLVGSGVVLGVVGLVFYTGARGKIDDAENAATYQEHQDLRDDAASQRNLAVGFAAGGALLVSAGIVRYMLRDTGERRNKVAVTPTHDGGLITWMGRF